MFKYYLRRLAKLFTTVLLLNYCLVACGQTKQQLKEYNVIWNTPSKDKTGQMPLGNGDIAAGVYAIENDNLYLLLAKNDAFTYSGDIFKTGRIKISMSPNPFEKGKTFKQVMDMETGSVEIIADGVNIKIWADANRPVYHVEIDAPKEVSVKVEPDLWERFDNCVHNVTRDPIEKPTQDVVLERDGNIIWYYAVGDRSQYPSDMKYYDVEDMIEKHPDPYRHNTFGNLLESPDMTLVNGSLSGTNKNFDIRIHSKSEQNPKISDWIDKLEVQASKPINTEQDWIAHRQWWSNFWNRSWISINDNTVSKDKGSGLNNEGYKKERSFNDAGALVAQSYNVFRYLMACQSRGRIQTKFNGGLFTQPLLTNLDDPSQKWSKKKLIKQANGTMLSHEDDRDWGRRFTYQNQRLLYWPMLRSGDHEMMKPFFDYYVNLLPVRKAITKEWFGHEGAYYRENIEPTGGERGCGRDGKPLKIGPGENKGQGYYHSFYFTNGLETVTMMIDYVKHTNDMEFKQDVLTPFAREVLLFFDKHYQRDENGKIRLDPAMVLETYWIAVNPAPDIAGLLFCLDGLLDIKAGSNEDQTNWQRFREEIPPVALREIDGKMAISPAEEFVDKKSNAENGELYPVFPFRLFGLGHGTEDIVDWTMEHRSTVDGMDYKCWSQDQIDWAYAGNAEEARDGLIHRFSHSSTQTRFPVYGSMGPDSCPDFDHFGSGSTALQRMLVQEVGDEILLLPAWPSNWDTDFKLHLSQNTVIKGKITQGKLENWSIEPASRKKDVKIFQPQ